MTEEQNQTPEEMAAAKRRRRRRWWVAAGVVVVVLAGCAVAAFLLLRESTTPVDVEEAVSDFRQEEQATTAPEANTTTPVPTIAAAMTVAPPATTVPAPGSAIPAVGVYTYATVGRESIDALGGRSHRYPDVSTITVTHEDCGAVLTWRPLRERSDATTVCPSDRGQLLRLYRSEHEFFNIDDSRDFVCQEGSLWFSARTKPGTTWRVRCAAGDIRVARIGTFVGTEQVDVGGTPVTVFTYELHDEISGASNGINDRTVRVVPETGLIVGLEVVVDVQNDSPIGDVHYEERYELRLTSLRPRR